MLIFSQRFVLYHVLAVFLLGFFCFPVNSQGPAAAAGTVSGDQEQSVSLLLQLKQFWGNPDSLRLWNSTSVPCKWPEILCSSDGSVVGIILEDKGISGEIPDFICDIKNLTYLDLSDNLIPGKFPTTLYNCSHLVYLDLSQNLLVGSIPDDIDRLINLNLLDLSGNNFTGDIPPAIGNLIGLKSLHLEANLFNGTFPAEIGNLSKLENLRMSYNGFSPAALPAEFGNLRNLKFLWLARANLIGEIPETFASLSNLEHLDLSLNSLSGKIPDGIFLLKNLRVFLLYHNQLSGSIPSSIQSLNMTDIDFSMNNFTGTIPEEIGKLQQLKVLNLFSNGIHGNVPASIGLLPSLVSFRVFRNNLTGVLPPELGFHSKLEAFEVSENQFTGKLPENLCARNTLFGVTAFSNGFSGEIPKSLENCQTLRTIQLYNNGFSGEVPSGVWTLLNLTSLMLSKNSFSGELPSKLAWNLTRLEIDNNKFAGEIPDLSSSWGVGLVVIKASNNSLSGQIPAEFTGLSQLTTLELDGNQFSGKLPSEIISWKSLTSLNLARNQFSGSIPGAIGSLPNLIDLDLSQNQFSGQIPPELGHLKLTTFNLSSNQLTGEIPPSLANMAYQNSFSNNPNLCSTSTTPFPNIPSCNESRIRAPKKLSSRTLAMILALTILLLIICAVMTMFMIRDYRRKKHKRDIITWKLTSFQRLDFTEANILSRLTEDNVIGAGGSGTVFKIDVSDYRSSSHVAVKRIKNKGKPSTLSLSDDHDDDKHEREFLAEVGILGSIVHTNIVKLLCCISSDDSKLLVYEYMENHSLDRWLHHSKKRNNCSFLTWPMRLNIAIGAAQGLCYMHHDCSPPILHRDVKSSNILLDSFFQAKIADFGLAKLLLKKDVPNTMSAIAGSFGYIAPGKQNKTKKQFFFFFFLFRFLANYKIHLFFAAEYAYTIKVNEKIDIYSFGVVLLELVTGREPNKGDDEHMSLAEWAWRHYGEGKPIQEAIDGEMKMKDEPYLGEMISVFKLGLVCTSTLPSSRPSMKEILNILQNTKLLQQGTGGGGGGGGGNGGGENGGKRARNEFDMAPLLGSGKYISSYKCNSKKVGVAIQDDDTFICTSV